MKRYDRVAILVIFLFMVAPLLIVSWVALVPATQSGWGFVALCSIVVMLVLGLIVFFRTPIREIIVTLDSRRATGLYPAVGLTESTEVVGTLIFVDAENRELIGKQVKLSRSGLVIGRTSDMADLVLDDKLVSQKHVLLVYKNGKFLIEDLNSRNGTLVNDVRLQSEKQAVLEDGSVIQIGSYTRLRFFQSKSAETIAPPELVPTVIGGDTVINLIDSPGLSETIEKPLSKVQFSGYCPETAHTEQEYGLYIFAYLDNSVIQQSIEREIAKFADELGGEIPEPARSLRPVALRDGVMITVVPECDELTFSPPRREKPWNGEKVKFTFDFTPGAKLLGERLFVRASIQVCGVEIAHLKWLIKVVGQQPKQGFEAWSLTASRNLPDENPLAAAKARSHLQHTRVYQKIFVSYSRQDTEVIAAYRFAQLALGNDVFVDTENIRTGANWQAELAQAIDAADILQLFWSENSAKSPNVHDEWDYALKYKCPDDRCEAFIRPVFWKKPMPNPPGELSHLNFRYVSLNNAPSD